MRKKLDELPTQPEDTVEGIQLDYMHRVATMIANAMAFGALKKAALDRSRLAKFDEWDAASRAPFTFVPGDQVVMTGKALNAMGVKVGGDVARVWTVLECACSLCRSGRFVCTDQVTAEDGPRHIASRALRLKSQPSGDDIDNMPMLDAGKYSVASGLDHRKVVYPPRRPPTGISAEQADAESRAAYEEAWRGIVGLVH